MIVVVWMRLGKKDLHCAHAYLNGKHLCNMTHGRFKVMPTSPAAPYPVELTPSGWPYGRTCQACVKLMRKLGAVSDPTAFPRERDAGSQH